MFDGQSPVSIEVTLELSQRSLVIKDRLGRPLGSYPRAKLRLERTGSHSRLSIDEGILIDLDEAATQRVSRQLKTQFEVKYSSLAVLTLAAVLVAVGLWNSVPVLSKGIAKRVPPAYEQTIGDYLSKNFEKANCASEQDLESLQAMLRRIGASELYPLEINIYLLPMDEPNAFAFPGGVVGVTRGLVRMVATPEELTAVVAHELGHLVERHHVAGIIRATVLTTLWGVTFGDYTGLLVLDPATLLQIASLEFQREDESEADEVALKVMLERNIDARSLATFFNRLSAGEAEWTTILSTHPASKNRAKRAEEISSLQVPSLLEPVLSEQAWADLKGSCQNEKAITLAEALQAGDRAR